MKYYLSIILGVACLVLVIALVATKRNQHDQHENDTGVIGDYSNQLSSAQAELEVRQGRILTVSNSLEESLSNSSALSNQMTGTLSALALEKEQSTNLNRRVAEVESENQTLGGLVAGLTNQIASLSRQLASNEVSLNVASNDCVRNYTLLENRLRRDVADRVIVDREFNDPLELQAQIERLKLHPAPPVTAHSIYDGLDVEVESNGTFHVLSPE
jgi:chromosome segregation ATPase